VVLCGVCRGFIANASTVEGERLGNGIKEGLEEKGQKLVGKEKEGREGKERRRRHGLLPYLTFGDFVETRLGGVSPKEKKKSQSDEEMIELLGRWLVGGGWKANSNRPRGGSGGVAGGRLQTGGEKEKTVAVGRALLTSRLSLKIYLIAFPKRGGTSLVILKSRSKSDAIDGQANRMKGITSWGELFMLERRGRWGGKGG